MQNTTNIEQSNKKMLCIYVVYPENYYTAQNLRNAYTNLGLSKLNKSSLNSTVAI
jgi:hypothetical protein